MDINQIRSLTKDNIPIYAKNLNDYDVRLLMDTLDEKDDKLRYNAFLLLQAHSRLQPSVYVYWDKLEKKLGSDNSYQRSLGVMLIAENVRWDNDSKFKQGIDKYFSCCSDEKFITSRQAIQALQVIIESTDKYNSEIAQRLLNLQLAQYKENQQKLLNKDMANILKIINKKPAS